MPIKADQLREKEDYQKLIMERLHEDNGFRIRPNTAFVITSLKKKNIIGIQLLFSSVEI